MTGPLEDFPEERRCSFFSWSPLGAVHKASMRRASFLKRLGRPRQRKVGHVLDNYLESWPANSHAKAKRNKSFKSHGLIRRACQTNTFSSRGGYTKNRRSTKALAQRAYPIMMKVMKKVKRENHGLQCKGELPSKRLCTRRRDGSGKPCWLNRLRDVCGEERCKKHCRCGGRGEGKYKLSDRRPSVASSSAPAHCQHPGRKSVDFIQVWCSLPSALTND